MPIICRLVKLTPEQAAALIARPQELAQAVARANAYSDVYRYWHAIAYLLARHRPDTAAAALLELGAAVSDATTQIPAARVILPAQVAELNAVLQTVEPDDLSDHYKPGALDRAGIYPRCWRKWERTFDPLGQVLEHYSYLQFFTKDRALAGDALLLYFVDDGEDDGTD